VPFHKLAHEKAYATGAIRTNLDLPFLARKLRRCGVDAALRDGRLHIRCDEHTWAFGDWEPDGIGRIGWIQIKELGDVGTLSRKLAKAGLRHRFEYSRPAEIDVTTRRCVTEYEYRWALPGVAPRAHVMPNINTYEEQV
jgi:hypothetical protein